MFVMASRRPPEPFAPSNRAPEKRVHQFTLRLTDRELDILEREAAKNGVSALNMIREILAERLAPPRKRSR